MNRIRRVFVCLAILSVIVTLVPAAQAQAAGNWEYVEELGGWLDWDTGLVWGDYWDIREYWGYSNWNSTATTFLSRHRIRTGIPNWRMATIAEMQTISANQGYLNWFPTWQPGDSQPYPSFTSATQGKKWAYAVSFFTGSVVQLDQKTLVIPMPVYRLFTP